jgi:hypothetical protein|mmetsp:Transcript_30736/g.49519  ORF Transcript_30736/g.49519 Transcript_30736/m.49519 type:complete len:196 (+) Transcript_30736:192-779(+)
MKPDWDTLIDEFKNSKTALVADVDCTAGGKSLCEKHNVQGYPTIKWGEPTDLKDYEGGRDLESLRKFATENLGPTCGPKNLDLCDEEDKKFLAKFMKWDIDELDMSIEEKDEKMKAMEAKAKKVIDGLESQVSGLQSKIEKEKKKKDDGIAKEKKSSGYNYMKAVKASRTPKVDADYDPELDEKDETPKQEKEDL